VDFNIFDQVAVDFFHDVYQGIAKQILREMLIYFIKKMNFFQLMYKRISIFDFEADSSCKPAGMTLENLTNSKMIRQSGAGVSCLIRYICLLIGDLFVFVCWELYYSKLFTLCNILSKRYFSHGWSAYYVKTAKRDIHGSDKIAPDSEVSFSNTLR